MRSDYALYAVAVIIFFILAGTVLAYPVEPKELWVIAAAIIGLFLGGLGYTQRPKLKAAAIEAPPTAAPPPSPPAVTEVAEEKAITITEAAPPKLELTKVKGIGEKRSEQLKALGISSVEDLAGASAKDLAEKLKISPKITERWIENAKRLLEKS